MNAILSIKPIYANAILQGVKTVEFRKKIFKKEQVKKVYIYSSAPVMKIVGYFTIEDIIKCEPNELWKSFGKEGGEDFSEQNLLNYFEGKEYGYAIKINSVTSFKSPKDPKQLIKNFVAPQNYRYTEVNL